MKCLEHVMISHFTQKIGKDFKKITKILGQSFAPNLGGVDPRQEAQLTRKKDSKMKHLLQCLKNQMIIEYTQKIGKDLQKFRKILGKSFASNSEGFDLRQQDTFNKNKGSKDEASSGSVWNI